MAISPFIHHAIRLLLELVVVVVAAVCDFLSYSISNTIRTCCGILWPYFGGGGGKGCACMLYGAFV